MNSIKCIYVNSLACVRVKGGKSECFRIDSGVGHMCIMVSLLLMYIRTQ